MPSNWRSCPRRIKKQGQRPPNITKSSSWPATGKGRPNVPSVGDPSRGKGANTRATTTTKEDKGKTRQRGEAKENRQGRPW